jgi:hypothetical protein
MTPNLQVILQAILAVTDANGEQVSTFDVGNPSLGARAVFIDRNVQATIFPVAVAFPAINMFFVLAQNVGTTPLQIQFAPNGLSLTAVTVGPTGFFLLIDPTETGTGIWSLHLSGLTQTVPALVAVGV